MEDKQVFNQKNATIVYQMTEEQLLNFAHQVVAETCDSVAEEIHKRVAHAMGNRFDYCSYREVCDITGKSSRTIYTWVKKGILNPVYNGNKMLFLRSEVIEHSKMAHSIK